MIKIEITADNAEGLASQLHEFVETFVKLARGTTPAPFDQAPAPTTKPAAPVDRTEAVMAAQAEKAAAEPRQTRPRKTAKVIDASADEADEPEAKPATTEPSDDDVRDILNKLRSTKGNEALGKVVTQFAPRFSEIPKTSYAQLYAVAKRALAA